MDEGALRIGMMDNWMNGLFGRDGSPSRPRVGLEKEKVSKRCQEKVSV